MEFDKEGRIILPGSIKEDIERDSESIILERIQVNAKNPAIAQLKIYLGDNLRKRVSEEALINEIYNFCKNFVDRTRRYNDVQSSIKLNGGNAVIIETRSSFQMYSFLNDIIVEMKELYVNNKGMKVSLRGSYGN